MARPKKPSTDDPHFHSDPDLFDPEAKNLLHVITLRSDTTHGDLIALSHPPLPSGVRLILPEDLPGHPSFSVAKSRMPLLNGGTLQYRGEPTALLVGPDRDQLRQLADGFDFITRKKPLGVGVEEEGPFRHRQLVHGDSPREDAPGLTWVEGSYGTGSQDPFLTTALTVTAVEKNGDLYLHLPTQWPSHVIQSVARLLVLDPARVHVEAVCSTAHADAQLWFPSLLACHAALAASVTKKPVRLSYAKDEEFYYSPKRPEARINLKTALDEAGRIVFMKGRVSLNFGAYAFLEPEYLDRTLMGLLGLYKVPAWDLVAQADRSHTPPRGPVGGLGEAITLTALENHALDLATATGLTPLAWKQLNLYPSDGPWFGGDAFKEPLPLIRLTEALATLTDYSRKQSAYHLMHQKRREFADEVLPKRGVGLTLGWQGNGNASADTAPASLEVRLETTGKVSVYCGLLPSTTRLAARWKKIVSALLTVPERDVRFNRIHSGALPDAGPATASRALEMVEKLLIQCCEAIAAKRFRQGLPITIKRPFRRAKHLHWNDDNFVGLPFISVTWGACMVEVEVSPVQAQVQVKRVSLLVEAGEILDEKAARTALLQGVQLGLGWALLENLSWENHRLSRAAFLKYRVPTLRDLPPIDIRFLPSAKYQPPKGLGDLGCQLVASAIASAFRQAIDHAVRHLPLTRKVIDDALRSYEN